MICSVFRVIAADYSTAGLCAVLLWFLATDALATPPNVYAREPANITTNSATLRAEVYTGDEPTQLFFTYNGTTVGPIAVAANASGSIIERAITGLTPGTYHQYKVQAQNASGVSNSGPLSFVTQAVFTAAAERKWEASYASTSSGFDRHNSVTTDSTGNIYVAGIGEAALSPGEPVPGTVENLHGKAYVAKRGPTGAVAWQRTFAELGGDSYEALDVAVHSNGDVAICGYFFSVDGDTDLFVAKYNSSGTLQWSRAYNGTDQIDDSGRRVAFDGSGNVIVTGHTERENEPDDPFDNTTAIVTLKYPAAGGAPSWTRTYNAPFGSAAVEALVVTPTGDAVVAGKSAENDGDSYYTAKYSSGTGSVLWTAPKTDFPNEDHQVRGLALAPNGDVAVTGEEYSYDFRSTTMYTRLYNGATGAQRWGVFLGFASGYAITFDAAGDAIVAGTRDRKLTNDEGDTRDAPTDFIVEKYRGSNGSFNWSREYSGSDDDDTPQAIRTDSASNVIVAGNRRFKRDDGGIEFRTDNFAACKIAGATGILMWQIQTADPFAAGVAGPMGPRGLVLTSDGGVVLVGVDFAGTDGNAIVEKYLQVAAPTPTTDPATSVTSTSAVLNGSALANNGRTNVRFEWGLTTSYGNTTTLADIGNTDVSVPHQATLTGLLPNRTYHFRLVATNAASAFSGPANGADRTFTTLRSGQTITFPALPTRSPGEAPFDLIATASSGVPVTFAATVGGEKIQLVGNRVTVLAGATPGLVTIRASAAQTPDFFAAPDVFQSFYIVGGNATFTALGVGTSAGASSRALGVSNGGLTVVGMRDDGAGGRPVRWAPALTIPLFDLSGGTDEGGANAVSNDGAIVAGHGRTAAGIEMALLSGAGPAISLGDFAGGITDGRATALTPNGAVVVGFGTTATVDQAARWTSGGLVNLGALSGGGRSAALGVSADGSVVVGRSQSQASGAGFEPFRWTSSKWNGRPRQPRPGAFLGRGDGDFRRRQRDRRRVEYRGRFGGVSQDRSCPAFLARRPCRWHARLRRKCGVCRWAIDRRLRHDSRNARGDAVGAGPAGACAA